MATEVKRVKYPEIMDRNEQLQANQYKTGRKVYEPLEDQVVFDATAMQEIAKLTAVVKSQAKQITALTRKVTGMKNSIEALKKKVK